MRSVLLLVVLVAAAPGCCSTPGGPCASGGLPALSAPAYRAAYEPGYRRPCYPAYRPIDSASSP